MTDKETYNVKEIADLLCVSPEKILRMCRQNKIKHIHINETHHDVRISKEEMERLVKGP